MSESEIGTGELRSLLQPVVYVRLREDIGGLCSGDVVGAQYWGNGKVTLTRVPDGKRAVGVAHAIKAETVNEVVIAGPMDYVIVHEPDPTALPG
jgi:hypothetical protein